MKRRLIGGLYSKVVLDLWERLCYDDVNMQGNDYVEKVEPDPWNLLVKTNVGSISNNMCLMPSDDGRYIFFLYIIKLNNGHVCGGTH